MYMYVECILVLYEYSQFGMTRTSKENNCSVLGLEGDIVVALRDEGRVR